ncbi:MAG: FtsQ-type POTRA domain-containing protein [Desulfovibrio sp.]|jgi:cell division protein FtsQ|nr:FtsQ-type POTRA domain-containing protein [Desulfovibrio sp.]
MAIKRNSPRDRLVRNSSRVPLTRGGPRAAPGKNTRRQEKRLLSFQPFSFAPAQKIRSLLSLAGLLSMLLILIAGVGFGLLYGYRSLTAGEYFALRKLEIKGNSRITSREILETADLVEGANTLALSLDAVEEALAKHPWIAEVSVKRVLPGTLIIGIREKVPAFWLRRGETLQYADIYGTPIAPVIPGKFASLPALEVEPGAEDAIWALPDLVRSLKESRLLSGMGAVSMVRLSSARGVELFVEESRLKITISIEEWLPNLRRLGLTLADLNRRGELSAVREIRAQGVNVWVEKISRDHG